MNQLLKTLVIAFAGLSVSACAVTGGVSSARGTHVQYSDTASNIKTDIHYLIHPDLVRIDYGSTGNYTLFDRKTQTIYDINVKTKSVREISGVAPVYTPEELGVTISSQASKLASNGSSTLYRFVKGDQACYSVVVLDTFLPTVDEALVEISAVRAADPRVAEMDKNSCEFIKIHLVDRLAPTYGTPARQWSSYGFSRFLEDFSTQLDLTENTEWYKFPDWYKPKRK